MATAATGTISGNGSATATISIVTGDAISVLGFGWGAGLWGQSTWGTARPTTVEVDAVNWTADMYGEDVIACEVCYDTAGVTDQKCTCRDVPEFDCAGY